jgi:hypothetical protein
MHASRPGVGLSLDDFVLGARFLTRLPGYLGHPIEVEQARQTLEARLAHRESDFLNLLRRAVYGHPRSPWLQLLRLAGCEGGDLASLVRQQGVEGALATLYSAGVYLTIDEFKGRQAVVRGSTTIHFRPTDWRNPCRPGGLQNSTGGSRGARVLVPIDLGFLAERSVNTRLFLAARGAECWQHAIWEAPGSSLVTLLRYYRGGLSIARWFVPLDPWRVGIDPRYRWGIRTVRLGALLAGVRLPRTWTVPLDEPTMIVQWLASVLRRGETPHLDTFTSPAVEVCRASARAGIDLTGAQLTVTGEPLTPSRLATIQQSGAQVVPSYRTVESGAIGYGCLSPSMPDEVHQYHDLIALILAGEGQNPAGLPANALLVSSLRPTAPLVMLNVSLGDEAIVTKRTCGCPLERLGWRTHLHTIRSFEKLTAGGVTFLDSDIIRLLEETLPVQFGGGPTDYQLVETETPDGRPRVTLVVHPRVGEIEPRLLAETFLDALSRQGESAALWQQLWQESGVLRVERRAPWTTANSKILHLHHEVSRGAAVQRGARQVQDDSAGSPE